MSVPTHPHSLSRWWLVACIAVLALQGVYFAHLSSCADPALKVSHLAVSSGDQASYTGAMDNLYETGRYFFINMQQQEVRAGRLPHYAIPYLLARPWGPQFASDFMVVLQLIALVVGMWLLADLLAQVTRKRWTGPVFLGAACLGGHLTPWALMLIPEAFACALVALTMHRFWLIELHGRPVDRWWLAIFVGLLVVVKPYFVPILPLIALWWFLRSTDKRQAMRHTLVLGVPLLILLAPWCVRNMVVTGRFIPLQQDLQAGYGYPEAEMRLRAFAKAMGEDGFVWWDPHSMASAMRLDPHPPSRYTWPSHFSPEMRAGAERVRSAYHQFQAEGTPESAERAIVLMDSVQSSYADQHPVRYHFTNRLQLVPAFLLNSGSHHLPIHAGNPCYRAWQLIQKAGASLAYLTSLLGLSLGLFVFLRKPHTRLWTWLVMPMMLIGLFAIVIGAVEWRYFASVFLTNLWVFVLLLSMAADRWQGTRRPAAVA
ncbi:MAG: hypothetical protein KF797_09675 [Flavobacteriales bacterium]|nr:hypothetical protein [Flavobacteriales bacterium]